MKAVQFDDYGGAEVLEVREVPLPKPGQVAFAVDGIHGETRIPP